MRTLRSLFLSKNHGVIQGWEKAEYQFCAVHQRPAPEWLLAESPRQLQAVLVPAAHTQHLGFSLVHIGELWPFVLLPSACPAGVFFMLSPQNTPTPPASSGSGFRADGKGTWEFPYATVARQVTEPELVCPLP